MISTSKKRKNVSIDEDVKTGKKITDEIFLYKILIYNL